MPTPSLAQRLGFHYFPDTIHYRVKDLEIWLPELIRMGAHWLTLIAPAERAVPEFFIKILQENGIKPILHFQFPTQPHLCVDALRVMFRSYAKWGVEWIGLFDRPNSRLTWDSSAWAQIELVERFIDLFLPIAEAALEEGLSPIFPPLEPGGDYWDLSFLGGALRSIKRRGRDHLLDKMALGAYAWVGSKPLGWGAGGPGKWQNSRPYNTPAGSEDHLGFHIFDWYSAIAQQELGRNLPVFLLRAGSLPSDHNNPVIGGTDLNIHSETNVAIGEALISDPRHSSTAIPLNVLCCCFWLLCASEQSEYADQAWFRRERAPLPVVKAFYRLSARDRLLEQENDLPIIPEHPSEMVVKDELAPPDHSVPQFTEEIESPEQPAQEPDQDLPARTPLKAQFHPQASLGPETPPEKRPHPITHYVLLPLYAWGVADWDLTAIQPLIQESHPTVGFSLAEARLATRVTIVGGEGVVTPEAMEMLRANGCQIDRVLDDGTLVAS